MFEINLIKDKAITPEVKKQVFSKIIVAGAVLGAVLFIILVLVIGMAVRGSFYNGAKKKINREIQDIVKKYNIDNCAKEWVGYNSSLKFLNNVFSDRIVWAYRLKEIEALLPPKTCIDKIIVADDNKSVELRLIVLAEERDVFNNVKKYMDLLAKSDNFGKNVKLEAQAIDKIDGKNVNLYKIIVPLLSEESGKDNKSRSRSVRTSGPARKNKKR